MNFINRIREKKFPIAIFSVALMVIGVALFLTLLRTPSKIENGSTLTIQIPKGSSFAKIAEILSDTGLVRNKFSFYFLAILKNAPRHVRAGEYEIATSMSPSVILDKLTRGEIKGYRILVPEGYGMHQIAANLADMGLAKEKRFIQLCGDRTFLSSLGIQAASAEGYLFPATYVLTKSMNEEEIIRLMVEKFWNKITPAITKRAEELGFSLDQILTIASMIEKEAQLKEEKVLIAAVFYNRLKMSMRLQSDPTAVYGLAKFQGAITRAHLRKTTPYNTYQINGLPPGPISNPGFDSIIAALYPAQVDYLYFVSKNDGSHQFSTNLSRHNAAVVRFRIKREKD